MDVKMKDLKKTWRAIGSEEELDEDQIMNMLHKRAGSLIERLDRNIKIGFGLLFLLIALFIFDDFVLSPMIFPEVENNVEMPYWLLFLSFFSDTLFLTTFLYFAVQYYQIKRRCDITCDLQGFLIKILRVLFIYKRLFYLALIILSVSMAIAFVTGMAMGLNEGEGGQEMMMEGVSFQKWAVAVLIGLILMGILVGGLFLFMRWGFRRLYGNYIYKLKSLLEELKDVEE